MKLVKQLFLYSFSILFSVIILSSCDGGDNDEDTKTGEENLVGDWTSQSIDIDMMVGDQTIVEYLVSEGVSQSEAELAAAYLKSEFEDEISDIELTFNSDKTFVVDSDDGDPSTGTWSYNESTSILTLDYDDPDEDTQDIPIKSLTSSVLVALQNEIVEEDINDDEVDEEIEITIELTFNK